jgi:hypothetical protein
MKKIKDFFWVVIGLAFVCFFIYKVGIRVLSDHLLKKNAQKTKAVIIDEKNYQVNQPVKPKFSYSYQFEINGKKYFGNAHDPSLKIGDTIEIEYVKDYPSLTKPLYPKE